MKFIFSLLIVFCLFSAKGQEVINLYTIIPNSKPSPNEEKVNSKTGFISKVSVPTITVYRPSKQNSKGTSVIICPGGGYFMLASTTEGSDVAIELNKLGITVFVLKYRIPSEKTMVDMSIGPLQDLQRAIQLVRERSKEWNLDGSKVGVMGFSAGGHLAASLCTQFDREVIENPQHISFRPDFSVLVYPVISLTDGLTHTYSRDALVGKDASSALINRFSNELNVTERTPSAFIVHAADDETVSVENSIVYYQSLLHKKVLSQMLLYPKGGHGFGLVNKSTPDKWTDSLRNWMISNGIL